MTWSRSKIIDCNLLISSVRANPFILEAGSEASSRGLYWQSIFHDAGLEAGIFFSGQEHSLKQLKSTIQKENPQLVLFLPYNETIGESMYLENILNEFRKVSPTAIFWADFSSSWLKTAYYISDWALDRIFIEDSSHFFTVGSGGVLGAAPEALVWQPEVEIWQNHHVQAKQVRSLLLKNNCSRINTVSNDFCECWKIYSPDNFIKELESQVVKINKIEPQLWVIHY